MSMLIVEITENFQPPDDEVARVQRAKELGYTIKAYHGTANLPVDRFHAPDHGYRQIIYTERDYFGVSFAVDPRVTSHYALNRQGESPNVMPVLLREPIYRLQKQEEYNIGNAQVARAMRDKLRSEGFNGVWFTDDEIKIWNPSAIRSVFARFDPAHRDSDDLMA